ncbi:hypothetical protein BpHYR1_030156 [Brachionus plicatilis]|uniref:Uncharacterized protein n=1 Tax=Brachionus plicatilis TaxID=10195 RepID=A0A3M7P9E7_BRAPC|nr:hypothetical protein BpHYR1_030156 [Brachionus plicatilis]
MTNIIRKGTWIENTQQWMSTKRSRSHKDLINHNIRKINKVSNRNLEELIHYNKTLRSYALKNNFKFAIALKLQIQK